MRNFVFKGMMDSKNYKQQVIPDKRDKLLDNAIYGEIYEFDGLDLETAEIDPITLKFIKDNRTDDSLHMVRVVEKISLFSSMFGKPQLYKEIITDVKCQMVNKSKETGYFFNGKRWVNYENQYGVSRDCMTHTGQYNDRG